MRPGSSTRSLIALSIFCGFGLVLSACHLPYEGVSGPARQRDGLVERAPETETYAEIRESDFVQVAAQPLSTFSTDVDTAAYANLRRFLLARELPPANAVRIEEMINYFSYDHAAPAGDEPIGVTAHLAACPWNERHRLMMVGLQARRVENETAPPRNLVFLLDVSGSMADDDKLPLLKPSMKRLAAGLRPCDRVAIVTYASESAVVLEPTSGDARATIDRSIDALAASGRTNGGAGIRTAYRLARKHFTREGQNRVILATDGDFNLGTVDHDALVALIEKERESGVFLTVVGLGTENLQDRTMQSLAQHGNGHYLYIDSSTEARKAFQRELAANTITVAKDVKVQVEFNPEHVRSYRLIGYENRALQAEDFNDDRKDAGEVGAGHAVTALYEIIPARAPAGVDPLRYQPIAAAPTPPHESRPDEAAFVKVRYKAPTDDASRKLTTIVRTNTVDTDATRFASAVAAFGLILRGSKHKGDATYDLVRRLATDALGRDPNGDRHEFVRLVDRAKDLDAARRG